MATRTKRCSPRLNKKALALIGGGFFFLSGWKLSIPTCGKTYSGKAVVSIANSQDQPNFWQE